MANESFTAFDMQPLLIFPLFLAVVLVVAGGCSLWAVLRPRDARRPARVRATPLVPVAAAGQGGGPVAAWPGRPRPA